MFDALIASQHRRASRRLAGSGTIAVLAHAALVGGAVWATLRRPLPAQARVPIVIDWPRSPVQAPRTGPTESLAGPDVDVGDIPTDVTPDLPIDVHAMRGPTVARPGDMARGPAWLGSGDLDGPLSAEVVEEQPVLLAGPPLTYPELLRRAGVAGRVIVQAVLDTLGHAEQGSVAVVESPNSGFDTAARTYVVGAVFRPARVHGRAVRVLVRVPIDFTLKGVR